MINVIFLSPHCDPQAELGEPDSGGQCIYEHELALALSALPDFKVTVFCRQNFQRSDETSVNNSYLIKRIECGGVKGRIPKETLEAILPEFSNRVYEYLQQNVPLETTILHAHYWDGAYAALHLKALTTTKLPLVWTPHSLGSTKHRHFTGEDQELQYHFIPRFCWESYGALLSDAVILSSQEEKETLLYDYRIPESKVQIVSPGVN